jgi:O-methyltransferase
MKLVKKTIMKLLRQNKEADIHQNPSIQEKISLLNNYSMSGLNVLNKLYTIGTDVINRNIDGAFVECGVYNGGSAGAISLALKDSNKHIWLYDSFEGMPEVGEVDGEDAKKYIGLCVGTIEMVSRSMDIAGVGKESFTIRKGWFEESFKLTLPEKIAILHVDCDWYDSVMLTFNTFYDRVENGGIIIVDDFGHWEGCREAVYDFLNSRGLKPLFERFGHSQIFWVKNRIHNRVFSENPDNDFSNQFHR